MTTWTTRTVCVLLAVAPAAGADNGGMKEKMADKGGAVTLNPGDIKWGEAPADVPKGAQLGVLHGDPTKTGEFTIRLKLPDGYKIPPHWHTQPEQLTIISGAFTLHMGDTMKADPHNLDVGAYHYLPAKMHHAAEVKGETIVQINGMGPFDIHYLNPADNPNPKSAQK